MSLLPHIDAMEPVSQMLITNLFSEYWAFNHIVTFTGYDGPRQRKSSYYHRLPQESAGFFLGTARWSELMVTLLLPIVRLSFREL